MIYPIFGLVIVVLVAVILFPETVNKIMYSGIPSEMRPDPDRHVPVASIALLVWCILLVHLIHSGHPRRVPLHDNSAAIMFRNIAGVVFFAFGIYCCLRPVASLKRLIWQLRAVPVSSIKSNLLLIRFAKLVGVVQIVGASLCLFPY